MLDFSIRIEGVKDAQGKIKRLPQQALTELQRKADQRAKQTVFRFKEEMNREYRSAWATHRVASSITYKTMIRGGGVDVKFYIGDFPELQYITAALGGYFQDFPVGPFVILPQEGKALVIRLPAGGRFFSRGKGGRFTGAREGPIVVKRVLWGRRTGGFHRDVISEVSQQEAQLFVQDMQAAVNDAIVKIM